MQAAFEFMAEGDNIVFATALALMALIGIAEAIGLGGVASHIGGDSDFNSDLLGWLGAGRLPLLVLLVVFLAVFGTIGLSLQQLMVALTGETLTPWLAAPIAAAVTLPVTGLLSRPLARILPRDETTAVSLDTLVGRRAVIITGRAAPGYPARARVRDEFGYDHYVMAEPDNAGQSFAEGEDIILVRRHDHIFRAISEGRALLPQLDG